MRTARFRTAAVAEPLRQLHHLVRHARVQRPVRVAEALHNRLRLLRRQRPAQRRECALERHRREERVRRPRLVEQPHDRLQQLVVAEVSPRAYRFRIASAGVLNSDSPQVIRSPSPAESRNCTFSARRGYAPPPPAPPRRELPDRVPVFQKPQRRQVTPKLSKYPASTTRRGGTVGRLTPGPTNGNVALSSGPPCLR